MRMRHLFGQTLRDTPAEAETASHRLLMRAGFIRPLGAGIFTSLHLAQRTLQKIEAILRDEMNKIGGQEISMPFVHPAEVWKESGRFLQIGPEMGRFQDRNGRDMVLAIAHEEIIADLARHEVQSYKHLPRLLYHIQTRWYDDPHPRAGLIRLRECTRLGSYSLDANSEGLEKQYRAHSQACINIFRRCGLPVQTVRTNPGITGGEQVHGFIYLTPIGDETILLCNACGYRANRQVARFHKPPAAPEEPRPIEKVRTPACKSIEDLAKFLGVPTAHTAKAVFFMATIPAEETTSEQFIFAVIRGDMELNETKLARVLGARALRPATEEEIRAIGAVPGFASPLGIKGKGEKEVLIVIDDSIQSSPNLVAGANETDYHLLNTNYPRDYAADLVTDLAAADDGHACPECGAPLQSTRGIEVGHIVQTGTRYSQALGCTFLDRDGQQRPIQMGSCEVDISRLLACIAEEHHDEQGLIWPVTVAPYHVHLVLLRGKGTPQAEEVANKLYTDLQNAGLEVLYDDRDESPGVKFNDADLIGLPVRVTVSERALTQSGVEIKLRSEPTRRVIPLDTAVAYIRSALNTLQSEILAS